MVRPLIFTKIGAEFICKEGYMVRGPMFTKMRPEFQSSEG